MRRRRLACSFGVLASLALTLMIGPAGSQTVLAQGPTLTCTAPNPADRFPAAHKYFMVIVDSSGSMTTTVSGAADSCGYRTGVGGLATRIDHARCAVNHIVSDFNATVDFGIAQYATKTTGSSTTCYQGWNYFSYPTNIGGVGCGPRPGDATTRAGARILEPVSPDPATILPWVDNDCFGGQEVGKDGNTPLNGALRDMKRYFASHWTAPDGLVTYSTPLTGNTCAGRSINVLLVTDGDETCDTVGTTDTNYYAVEAARDLYQNGVTVGGVNYKVKTYVVNFAGGNQASTDEIAAAGGTGASYFATNETQLLAAMQDIMAAPADAFNGVDDDCNSCVDDGWSQLSLTGSASPTVAQPGETVTYTFEAQNIGPTDADARVQITAATETSSLGISPLAGPAGWSCVGGVCTNQDFPVGGTATFTVTGLVTGAAVDGVQPSLTLEISPITYVKDPDLANNTASASVTIHVKATPTVTWPTPADIVYGTPLDGTQLNATASAPGTFSYNPISGTVLDVGTHTLLAEFAPADPDNYNPASATVSINVTPAPSTVTVNCPSSVSYTGSALTPCTAEATGVGMSPVDVTASLVYANNTNAGAATVTASWAGDTNHTGSSGSGGFSITPVPAVLSWPTPAAIPFGTPLSGAQLNATANVPGSFVYTPPAGTVLPIGRHTLTVAFTPGDSNHTPASASVSLDVIFGFCLSYDAGQAKQAGSTIPLKIRLCDANGQTIPTANLVLTARSVISGSTGATQPPQDSGNANPGGVFRMVSDGYMFNLQTAKDMAGPYTLTFTVGTDPRLYSLPFMVRAR